ncbi:MAG: RIP metalloprotease RseP [Natronospirillum sp.]
MDILQSLIFNIGALIVTLGILVTFHEYGHFWVARRCGVKVERFSIGFGKPLLRWQRGETEYVVAAIPLGGYVKMLGEQEQGVPGHEAHRAFANQSLARRSAIILAGPAANFLLAIILYWLMFVVGVSEVAPVVGDVEAESPAARSGLQAGDEIVAVDGEATRTWQEVRLALLHRLGETGALNMTLSRPDSSTERRIEMPLQRWLVGEGDPDIMGALGITPYRVDIPARIGEVLEGGRAEQAGLMPGDLVTAVNGEPVSGWMDWVETVRANPETRLLVNVQRNGENQELAMTPALNSEGAGESHGYIGAGVMEPETMPQLPEAMQREVQYSPLAALPRAASETWETSWFVLGSLKKMLIGLISVENLSGPITIAQVAGQTASYGFEYFVGFLAVLSISLGVLNLLPIPMLDGGHLLYNLVEFVTRKPVSERVQQMGMQLGILLILSFTLIAFYNDFNRLL